MKYLLILLLLAGCSGVVTDGNTPTPIASLTPEYPKEITVIPRAIGSIDVHEALCRTRYTKYLLWPNLFLVQRDNEGYSRCLLEGI